MYYITRANDIEQPKCKKLKIMDFLDDEEEVYLSSLSTNNRRNVTRQVEEYMEMEAIRKCVKNIRL